MSKHFFFLSLLAFFISSCDKKTGSPDPGTSNSEPVITSFTPSSGSVGAEVTINGQGFSTDKTKNTVKFNGVVAMVNEATNNQLKVSVPTGASTGKVSVSVAGKTTYSVSDFTVIGTNPPGPNLSITGVSPLSGNAGVLVKVTATNIDDNPIVKVNGVTALITEKWGTYVTFVVPVGIPAGAYKISLTSNGQTVQSVQDFTVTGMSNYQWSSRLDNMQVDKVYSNAAVFVHNNTIYMGLGTDISAGANNAKNNSFWRYDIAAGSWSQSAQVPSGFVLRDRAVSVVYNNKVYVGLGLGMSDWWVLENPADNTSWRSLTSFPLTGDNAFAFVANNNLYVAALKNSAANPKPTTIYQFHAADNSGLGRWQEVAQINDDIYWSATFTIGNDVYIGGDVDLAEDARPYYKFSPQNNNAIIKVTSLPMGDNINQRKGNAFALNGKGYVLMANKKVCEYTPDVNGGTWRVALDYAGAPEVHHAVTLGDKAYGWNYVGYMYEFRQQ